MLKRGERVLGPYPDRGGWRVIVVAADGTRRRRRFAEEEQAKGYVAGAKDQQAAAALTTVGAAIEGYEEHLTTKGNRESSITTTLHRLRSFFSDETMSVRRLTATWCSVRYAELAGSVKVDTHRNTLAEARTFARWLVKTGRLLANPLEKVEGTGRRKHGKAQLRIDEARQWEDVAIRLARVGDAGAVAALLTYWCGMRSGEVVARVVRDIDDGGRVLWIPESKTEAGRRRVSIPEALRRPLLALIKKREPDALIFGPHWRDWPRHQVKRICDLAGVPPITAHGMRGTFATVALEEGVSLHRASRSMGHRSTKVTATSYAKPEAVAGARQRAGLRVMKGGKR
jgi:integrase